MKFSDIKKFWENRLGVITSSSKRNSKNDITGSICRKKEVTSQRGGVISGNASHYRVDSVREQSAELRHNEMEIRRGIQKKPQFDPQLRSAPASVNTSPMRGVLQPSASHLKSGFRGIPPSSTHSSPIHVGASGSIPRNNKFKDLHKFWQTREKTLIKKSVDKRKCVECGKHLSNNVYQHGNALFCEHDFLNKFGHRCKTCYVIITGPIVIAGLHRYHPECFKCVECTRCISDGDRYALVQDSTKLRLFCNSCYQTWLKVAVETREQCVVTLVVNFLPVLDQPLCKGTLPDTKLIHTRFGISLKDSSDGQVVCGLDGESSLEIGDRLLQVNGLSVDHNAMDLIERLSDPGIPLQITIQRKFPSNFSDSGNSPKPQSPSKVIQVQPQPLAATENRGSEGIPPICSSFSPDLCCDVHPFKGGIPGLGLEIGAAVESTKQETSLVTETVSNDSAKTSDIVEEIVPLHLKDLTTDSLPLKEDQRTLDDKLDSLSDGGSISEKVDVIDDTLPPQEDKEESGLIAEEISTSDDGEVLRSSVSSDTSTIIVLFEDLPHEFDPETSPEIDHNDYYESTCHEHDNGFDSRENDGTGFRETDSGENLSEDHKHDCDAINHELIGHNADDDLILSTIASRRGGIKRKNLPNEEILDVPMRATCTRRCNSLRNEGSVILRKESPRRGTATLSIHSPVLSYHQYPRVPTSDLNRSESMRITPNSKHRVFRPCDLILGEVLGQGFFGKAIKVSHRDTGEVMVLKVLNSLDEEIEKSFLKEVKVLRNLSHPNVLHFIGVLYQDKRLNIITEFAECGTLKGLISNMAEQLTWRHRTRIAMDIASGMAYLHSMQVIHRDLNSANCFIRENGMIVVADFGLARVLPKSTSMGRRKRYTVVGTPYWMAPEILYYNSYDERVDVFSFSIVLCEIIGRVEADPDFLPRDNDFGLSVVAFYKKFCSECPPFLFALAAQSSSMVPDERPSFQMMEAWLEMLVMREDLPHLLEPPKLRDLILGVYSKYNIHLPPDLFDPQVCDVV